MQTEQLKVYQDTVELSKTIHQTTANFPRFEKYSIGAKLFCDSLELIKLISRANRSMAERGHWLSEYLVLFESVKTVLKLAVELRVMPKGSLLRMARLVTTIEKQVTGWKKSAAAQMSGIGNGQDRPSETGWGKAPYPQPLKA